MAAVDRASSLHTHRSSLAVRQTRSPTQVGVHFSASAPAGWTPAFAGALGSDDSQSFAPPARSAEHGFTPFLRSAEHGFTLVELMVALAIVGLATAAIVLTMPSADGGARAEATRFAARVAALRDRAVVEGRTQGLWVSASGYGFERRVAQGWAPITDGKLARADWRAGTAIAVDGVAQGRLSFDRVGLPDRPMSIAFTAGGGAARVAIDAAGKVSVQ